MRFLAPLLLASSFSGCVAADLSFDKQTLTKDFVAEGCAVADFDHDGHADVVAGRYIWRGPDFKQKFAYTPERDNPAGPSKTPYTAATGYSDYFIQFAYDFNGDGWSDILVYGLPGEPAFVFENPQGKAGDWTRHNIFDVADGESPEKAASPAGSSATSKSTGRTPSPKDVSAPSPPSRRPTTRRSSSTPTATAPGTSMATAASTSSKRMAGMNSRPTPLRTLTGSSTP
jgi:hypothetical protein